MNFGRYKKLLILASTILLMITALIITYNIAPVFKIQPQNDPANNCVIVHTGYGQEDFVLFFT